MSRVDSNLNSGSLWPSVNDDVSRITRPPPSEPIAGWEEGGFLQKRPSYIFGDNSHRMNRGATQPLWENDANRQGSGGIHRYDGDFVEVPRDSRAVGGPGHPKWAANAVPLSGDKMLHDRLMKSYVEAKRVVSDARAKINLPWSKETKEKMKSLFGTDDQAKLAPQLEWRLDKIEDNLESFIKSDGSNLYLKDNNINGNNKSDASVDYEDGEHGRIIDNRVYWSKEYVDKSDIEKLARTAIHESSHMALGADDLWYVDPGKNNDFVRRPTTDPPKPLPPHTTDSSLKNADTLARAVQVLDENQPPRVLSRPAPFQTIASDVTKGPDAGWQNYIQDLGPRGIIVYQPQWRVEGGHRESRPPTDPPQISGYELSPSETRKDENTIIYYYSKTKSP